MQKKTPYDGLKQRVKALERDATNGKRAQIALERKITELDSFINNIPDMAWIKDENSRFIVVNSAFGETVGMDPESLIHQTCEVCFGKQEAKKFQEDDQKVLQNKSQSIIEEQILDAQNHQIWLETIKSPILDESGTAVGTVGIARDITRRKQAEEALRIAHQDLERKVEERTDELVKRNEQLNQETQERIQAENDLKESKERYALATRAGKVGVWDWNMQTQIFYLDPNVKAILGYGDDEIPNDLDVWATYVHPDDRQGVMDAFQAHITGKTPEYVYEHRMLHKDGSIRWILVRGKVIRDTKGNPVRVVGSDTDITIRKQVEIEKKKLESQLQISQKMEAIGTLAGGIAHDFNNLLMAIQGSVSLMLFDIDSNHPHYEMLNTIEKQIKSGAKLTHQLLGYARKGRYEVKPLDINKLIRETSDTFGRTRKEITINQDLAEDLSAIEADEGQIEQVVLNLFINAWQAMPDGGKLFLKTMDANADNMKSKLYNPKQGKYVLVQITDTGAGMDEKTKKRIFEPFFTTKKMGRGTGLGLASVYGIIKGHGGYIDVESEVEKGTTFHIYLPASPISPSRTTDGDGAISGGTGLILLVDDEERVLDIGTKMLNKLGYTVLEAKGGNEAVEIFKAEKNRIDLIILDMIMPDVSGGEAYDRIKRINANVKVLLSSGYTLGGRANEILQRGCNGFIQKPFTMQKLSEKIGEILALE